MYFWLAAIFIALILLQVGYSAYHFHVAGKLAQTTYARKTTLGEKTKPVFKLFIDGDSVGAGVGATRFENSTAGRLAEYFSQKNYLGFENISKSGKKVADVLDSPAPDEKQNLIVLIVSSNNLFRLTNLSKFESDSEKLFAKYSPLAEKVLLVGPGRVGDSTAIPFFVRPYYRYQGKKYAAVLKKEAPNFPNVAHINPQEHAALFENYGDTLAADKFHPNDQGHKFWFDLIVAGFETQTPGG
jgi:lysophospholipase L1-like esterase